MLNRIKKIIQEPLLHFLLLGGLIYFYFDYFTEVKQPSYIKPSLTIENYELKNLQQETQIKDRTLLLEFLKYKKILLAEAYSLELYKEDKKINAMLLKKMEYLFKTDKQFQEPSEEKLKEFYNTHLQDYSILQSFDLYTITLSQNADIEVIKKLSIISNLLPRATKQPHLTPSLLEEKYGRYLTLKLSTLPQRFWSEVFQIGQKQMIFFITNKQVGEPYPFEEIEDLVYKNYRQAFLLENEQQEYAKLYNKYILKVQE